MDQENHDVCYREMIAEMRERSEILAAILSGSRARGFGGQNSDTDMFVIVTDGMDESQVSGLAQTLHGQYSQSVAIDLTGQGVQTLSTFRKFARIPSPTAWNRYGLVHAVLEFDNSGGLVSEILESRQRLSVEEKPEQIRRNLPQYLNFFYRSIQSQVRGDKLAATLSACRSLHFLLNTLFALHDRIAPFNCFLQWELAHYPLPDLDPRVWYRRLNRIAARASRADQEACCREIMILARQQGYGSYFDGKVSALTGTWD